MSLELKNYLENRKKLIDDGLERFLPSADSYPEKIHQAVRYSVFAGGKRIRPILLLASYELFKKDIKPALGFACGLEMIHTYSLIHDDLPSMDNDDFRRGKPTCHKVFGEAVAILAGDALLTYAFGLMAEAGLKSKLSSELVLKVIFEIAHSAGLGGMISGQALDIEKQGRGFDEKELEFIHSHKTGALIRAGVVSGALLGKAQEREIKALSEFGARVGLAFQIVDDILDVKGGEDLGKPRGRDQRQEKATYPKLIGLNKSEKRAEKLIKDAVTYLEIFGKEARVLKELAGYLIARSY